MLESCLPEQEILRSIRVGGTGGKWEFRGLFKIPQTLVELDCNNLSSYIIYNIIRMQHIFWRVAQYKWIYIHVLRKT